MMNPVGERYTTLSMEQIGDFLQYREARRHSDAPPDAEASSMLALVDGDPVLLTMEELAEIARRPGRIGARHGNSSN